jgi:hypothetical protein
VQSLCMTYETKNILATGAIIALIAAELLFLTAHPAHAAVSSWQQGATMQPRSTTDFGSTSFQQSLTNLKNTGASAVAFVYPIYQDNPSSSDLHAGWNTPTDASLRAAIKQAHALGMSVNLKLHAEVHDGTWRAHIRPSNRDAWYGSYNSHLVRLATIAKEEGVALITIGTEMVATAASSENPDNTQRWQKMISNVRAIYSGKLAYGANSNSNDNSPFTNEKKYIGFWSSLDYAGISAYYQLNSDSSVEGLKGAWDWWNNNDIRGFQQSVGKPLLFAEVGYRSVDGAHWEPWNWAKGGGANQTEQANAYEALMSYWNNYDYIAGIYWWDWSTDPNAGGGGTDYTPQRKTAEAVMTKWFTTGQQPTNPGGTTSGAFSSTASANPGGTAVGSTVTLSAQIKSLTTGPTSNTLVDIEVFNQAGQKVFQQFYENQNFGSQETRNYQVGWQPTAAGTYRMTVGVFSAGWTQNYHWNNSAAEVTVSGSATPPPNNPPPTPPPTNPPATNPPPATGNINIWWPTDGTRVSGVQPLKAVVDGREVGSYRMVWRVDDGTQVEMFNSNEDYPHKEAWVDYSGWSWKGAGPYTLTFIAEEGGATIGSKSVNIYTR